MARNIIIEQLVKLAQSIGANPNKFIGTKSNINFLGVGNKATEGRIFSKSLPLDFKPGPGLDKEALIKIIEDDMGYATADKLNTSQLQVMKNNLDLINKIVNPPANITDLATGTAGLNKKGLESLRGGEEFKQTGSMTDRIKKGINTLKTRLRSSDEIKAEDDFIKKGGFDEGDSVQAEGARRAVVRNLLSKDPDYFLLSPETAESITKYRDLGKGGGSFSDPLTVFNNVGSFTRKELSDIDDIISTNALDDINTITKRVKEYIDEIRPGGFKSLFAVGGLARILEL